jgi:hypothetical protein
MYKNYFIRFFFFFLTSTSSGFKERHFIAISRETLKDYFVSTITVGPVSCWFSLKYATWVWPKNLDYEAIVGTDERAQTFVPTWRFVWLDGAGIGRCTLYNLQTVQEFSSCFQILILAMLLLKSVLDLALYIWHLGLKEFSCLILARSQHDDGTR